MTQDFWTSDDPDVLRAGLTKIVDQGLSTDDKTKFETLIKKVTTDELQLNRGKLRNYHVWADTNGISDKGYAMFMSIIPHTIRFLYTKWVVEGSRGTSLPIGALLNGHCRLAGGSLTAVRTSENALL